MNKDSQTKNCRGLHLSMKIGFLGDSITLGYGLAHPEADRFSRLIAEETGHEEHNFGICGTLVARAGLSRSNGTAYVDRIGQLRGMDLAVIFGGTNDYFWTDCDLCPPAGGAGDVRYFTEAVSSVIAQARDFLPDERLLFVTPYPHHGIGNFRGGDSALASSEHDTTLPNYAGRTLDDYCDALVDICEAQGIRVLDLRQAAEPFCWQSMTSDGCHPSPEGHRWLARHIGRAIREMTE